MTEQMNDKPNGVLFKTDLDNLVVCLIKDNQFDWENVLHLKMNEELENEYKDISSDPFEFVFIKWNETSITTMNQKSTIPNYTFSKLYDENKLEQTIKLDYEKQYGSL
jgi:hypothetical protein